MNIHEEIKMKDKKFNDAINHNLELGEGLKVGKCFRIPVADGYSLYEVIRIKSNTVEIKWRKDAIVDNYQDLVLADGGEFPIETIERLVKREDKLQKIFGGKNNGIY